MNEELINKVVAILDEQWGNEDWKKLSAAEKIRLVKEQLLNKTVQETRVTHVLPLTENAS